MTSKTNYYDQDICVRYHPSYWYHKSFEWTINRSTILKLVNSVTPSPSLPYSSLKATLAASPYLGYYHTRRVPVEGKSSVCLMCMKYRIIILIIIIISLGQILLSYIANTSRTHACQRTRAHACASTHTHRRHHRRTWLALFIGAHP